MNTRWKWPVAAVALLGAAAAVFWLWPREPASPPSAAARQPSPMYPERPRTPPVPGQDRPRPAPMPEFPPQSSEIQAKAYAEARAAGEARPGDKAFRATVDAFMKYNRAFAEEQARREGITVDEVAELTYFGFLALQTQRWTEVEEIIGRALSEEERIAGEDLLHAANTEFKDALRKLVADGAPQEARWKLIRDTQERYLREYFALTGMTPAALDDFLAGDVTRTGAPVVTPPPEDIEPAPAPPRVETRPERTPEPTP
jgi:hypothetical protein